MGAGAKPPCPGPCPGANDACGAGAGAREPMALPMCAMIALGSAPKKDICYLFSQYVALPASPIEPPPCVCAEGWSL
jgi:hypothetical protein